MSFLCLFYYSSYWCICFKVYGHLGHWGYVGQCYLLFENPYNPASIAACRAGTALAPAVILSFSQVFEYVFSAIWNNNVIKKHNFGKTIWKKSVWRILTSAISTLRSHSLTLFFSWPWDSLTSMYCRTCGTWKSANWPLNFLFRASALFRSCQEKKIHIMAFGQWSTTPKSTNVFFSLVFDFNNGWRITRIWIFIYLLPWCWVLKCI